MKVTIKLQNGQSVEKITDASKIVIGRSPKCDFAVQDPALSRNHCVLECVNGEFFVTDLGSSNGVYLQGERVEPNKRTQFFTYVQLSLASLDCLVQDIDEVEMHAYTTLTATMQNKKPIPKGVEVKPGVAEAPIQDILETVKPAGEAPAPPVAAPAAAAVTAQASPAAQKKISKEVLSTPLAKKAKPAATSTPDKSATQKPPKSIHRPEKTIKMLAAILIVVLMYVIYEYFFADSPL